MLQSNVRLATAALLFGGTLGLSADAHASVVGIPGNSSTANLSLAYVYETGASFGAWGSPMDGSVSFSDSTFGSISCTQFTASGFSLSINSTAAANNQSFFVQQSFIVTEAVNFTLTGYLPVSSSRAFIHQGDTFFADSGSDAGVYSLSGTLQAGEYRFAYFSGATGAESGTLFNLTFTAVPAPGAVALVGLAGLVTGRRRRD
jgi:MYXO-CTERM domain-containing protein